MAGLGAADGGLLAQAGLGAVHTRRAQLRRGLQAHPADACLTERAWAFEQVRQRDATVSAVPRHGMRAPVLAARGYALGFWGVKLGFWGS